MGATDSSRTGPYQCTSKNRNHTHGSLVFKTAGASSPAAADNVDPLGLISTVARTATGTIKVTLNQNYKTIHAVPGVAGTAGAKANCTSDTNSITVTTYAAAGSSAGDLATNTNITLSLDLYGS